MKKYIWGITIVFIFIASLILIWWWDRREQKEYIDPVHHFKMTLPAGFSSVGVIDGIYAYTKYFASKETGGNFNQIGANDVQLSVSISKDEKEINNAEKLKEIKGLGVAISDIENITVDGVPALQEIEDTTVLPNGGGECTLATYFIKNSQSHEISLVSPGGCNIVKKFLTEYNLIIKTFHY